MGMLKSVDVIIPSVLLAKGRAEINLRFNTILFFVLPAAFSSDAGLEGSTE